MLTLAKVERLAGLAANMPPCSDGNYKQLIESFRTVLGEWKNEMEDNIKYRLQLLEYAGAAQGNQDLFETSRFTTEYKNRAIEMITYGMEPKLCKTNGRAR